jgi:hypothetical protein
MKTAVDQDVSVGAPARSHDPRVVSDWDRETYLSLVSTELSDEQRERIETPDKVFERQKAVLAVHWHPEFIPLDMIRRRIDATFPGRTTELIIPTQHNRLTDYDGYTGVEVDCFSPEFNRKVQLLIHFESPRMEGADVFKSMLAHTFKYRSQQLFEFIDTIIEPGLANRFAQAVAKAQPDKEVVSFVVDHTRKLRELFTEFESHTPVEAVRNKLLTHYIRALKAHVDEELVAHAEVFLAAVKTVVKRYFSNEYFYNTREVIEEVRGLQGGIVIPHPEQFWPVLLADYDVDGYEVWNPQSREYTEFLINVVNAQNTTFRKGRNPILIFMGDDCHMGEKAKDPRYQDPEKAGREIGVQPAWEDLSIRKSLIVAKADRRQVIEDYRARLAG